MQVQERLTAGPGAGSIRVGAASEIPGLLREFGVDPAALLAEVGLAESFLADPDNHFPYRTLGRLLSLCVAATRCERFGLLLGQRSGSSALGIVGFLIRQAPDVRTALDDLVRYLHTHDRGAVPRLSASDGSVLLSYNIYDREAESADQISDGAVAIGLILMRDLCGPAWSPTEVFLPRRKPADPAAFRTFFGAPVRFDSDQAALVFSTECLGHAIPRADPRLRRFILQHLPEPGRPGISEDIRRALRGSLGQTPLSRHDIAKFLNVSQRTLNRRLKHEGTDYRRVAEEVRFSTACQLLRHTQLPLAQIAARLDYSETSAFTRAFKRWSGQTPSVWRTTAVKSQP